MLPRGPGDNLQLNMTVRHEHASVAQRIAHRLSTPMVAGSNPAGGTESDAGTGVSLLSRHKCSRRRRASKDPRAVGKLGQSAWLGARKSRVRIAPARPTSSGKPLLERTKENIMGRFT